MHKTVQNEENSEADCSSVGPRAEKDEFVLGMLSIESNLCLCRVGLSLYLSSMTNYI